MSNDVFRKIVIIGLVSIVIMGIFAVLFDIHNSGLSTELIELDTIVVTKDTIHITGELKAKRKGYYGFSYRFYRGQLYIKPKCFWFRDGRFDITIVENLQSIDCIYLSGIAKGDNKMIWTREWGVEPK